MTKRMLALLVGLSLLVSLSAPAFAAEDEESGQSETIVSDETIPESGEKEEDPIPQEAPEEPAADPESEEEPSQEPEPEEEPTQEPEPEEEPAQETEPEEEPTQETEPEEEPAQEPESEEEPTQETEPEEEPTQEPESEEESTQEPESEEEPSQETETEETEEEMPEEEHNIPDPAVVYWEQDGSYSQLSHGEEAPIALEHFHNQTLYILSSEEPQNLYFTCKSLLGHRYSLSESEYAGMTCEDGDAVVTLLPNAPHGTELTLTASLLLTRYSVTIRVLDQLPEAPTEEPTEGQTGREVTVDGKLFSADTELTVAAVTAEKWTAIVQTFLRSRGLQNQQFHSFDISAGEPAIITIQGLVDSVVSGKVTMIHLLDDPAAIGRMLESGQSTWFAADPLIFPRETAAAMEAGAGENRVYYSTETLSVNADGSVTFSVDSYSTFLFVVTFGYEGKTYTLEGSGSVRLSDLLASLGIAKQAASVSFSNPSLISIQPDNGDWLLTSLQSFTTEEFLTVTFTDGQVLVIRVTDPVYHYYLWDNNGVNKDGHVMWNEGTQQRTVDGVSRHTNATIITAKEVYDRANTDSDVDIQIYARPGMAIGFTRGTVWGTRSGSGWNWYWDNETNWVILEDVGSITEITFSLTVGTDGGFVSSPSPAGYECTVKIVVIPNPDPSPYAGSIRTLPITLYDYDGRAWNSHYGGADAAVPFFAFASTVQGETADNYPNPQYGPNTGGSAAIMGILQEKLGSDNLPVMAGNYQQVDLFSANEFSGKRVYPNVQFPFLYDEASGYYRYDSSQNHAQLNEAGTALTLYNQALSHGYESGTKGGLYPFNHIQDGELLKDGNFALDPVSSSSVNPASRMNMHLGIQLAANFYLPQDRLSNADEEIVYEFTGDDDLWVFIDDQLVLDIGGGHTPVSGRINITTGAWYVGVGRNLGSSASGSRSGQFDISTNAAFQADAMHTLRIFYLERHSGESNCLMRFNLPIAPANSLTITKNLQNQDGESLSITPDTAYTFTVQTKANAAAADYAPLKNAAYTILGDASQQVLTTDENGRFQLKPGQSAQFTEIQRFTMIQVKEDTPDDGYVYRENARVSCSTYTGDYAYDQFTRPLEMGLSGVSYTFTNYLQTQPLTVEKQVTGGSGGLLNPGQNFVFDLTFTKNCLSQSALAATGNVTNVPLENRNGYLGGEFRLAHGQHITIPRVPVNMTYQLLEQEPDPVNHSFAVPFFQLNAQQEAEVPFDTCFGGTEGKTILDGGENKITVTNQQFFNLTITKRGIHTFDNSGDETQNTLYEVTGPENFRMLLTILGNAGAVIQQLPLGQYTVRELTDWSWRYASAQDRQTVTPDAFQETLVFENTRVISQWLSGDCYGRNLWTENGIVTGYPVN